MSGEQEKKPEQVNKRWQFSLGQVMIAITVICITLAAAVALWQAGAGIGNAVAVILAGLFSAIGALLNCKKRGIIGAAKGLVVFIVVLILLELFLQAISAFFN